MRDTTGSGGLSDNVAAGVRRRENLKLQVNSMPAVAAQRVNGTSHTVKPPSHATQPAPAPTPRDGLPVKKRMCARCATQLGRFFNTGSPCPSCGQKTCSNCRIRVYLPDRKKTWFCTLCVKERQTPRKNPNEWMQRRNSVLRRDPLPIMIANEALLNVSRDATYSSHAPLSNRISYNGSLPRSFTALSDPLGGQLTMSDYYTATRGRPVSTPGTSGTRERKRAPPIPQKPARTLQVVTAPAVELNKTKYQSATLGRPVKNLLSPMAARRWEETTEVVTTLRRPKQVLKEKYIHVEVVSMSTVESRSSLTFSPKSVRKEGFENHPKLLNGVVGMSHVSPYVKSTTLDRAYLHRHSSFSEDSPSNSTGEHQLNNSHKNGEASSSSNNSISINAVTLPRAGRKVKRDESLLSTHSTYMGSRDPEQSLSLLNLAHKSGLPQSEILTKPQPGLNHQAGLCHPSYAVFSRSDSRRRSFMDRGSLRRNSFRLDESLYKAIWNAVALDYDDFLTVVKTNLKHIAEFNLVLSTHDKIPRRSSSPSTSSPSDFNTDKPSIVPCNPMEMTRSSELLADARDQGRVPSTIPIEVFRKSSLTNRSNTFTQRETSAKVSPTNSPTEHRHVSIIEIKPVPSSGSSESSDLNSKNVFEITEIVPDVEVVLHEISNQKDIGKSENRPLAQNDGAQDDVLPSKVRIEMEKDIPSGDASPVKLENLEKSPAKPLLNAQRAISPPVAFFKSPEVKPRKSLAVNGGLKEKPLEEVPPVVRPTHLFTAHVDSAKSEISSILNGIPKLREVPKQTHASTEKKTKEDGIAEFQRVLGNLREAKKPPDLVRIRTTETPVAERVDVGDEVQKVSDAIQHFKKVSEEVQDLKDFLKSMRQGTRNNDASSLKNGSKPDIELKVEAHTDELGVTPEVSTEPIPFALTEKYAKSKKPDQAIEDDVFRAKPGYNATISLNGSHKVQEPKVPFPALENSTEEDASSLPNSPSASSTSIQIIQAEPVTLETQPTTLETRRPERAKWHSNLLNPHNNGAQSDEVEPDVPSVSLNSPAELLPVKKCVPATQRPVFFSQGSSDGEEQAEADFEEESNSSTNSDDGIPTVPAVKACRKVEVNDEEVDPVEAVETWEVEPQPAPYDYFGRLQVPLDSIQEESEDEERESKFTWTINRKAMRPVVNLDLSPDEGDDDGVEDLNAWHTGEEPIGGQSDLEQYFITGLLQPSGNKPYFRDEMDFDTLEDEEIRVTKEPSIFGSAKLRFASSDYRLSSDMDDLSASSPSDDESFY